MHSKEQLNNLRRDLPASRIAASDSATMDRLALAAGLDLWVLMQRAGEALAAYAQQLISDHALGDGPITICCGGGNNGGDGYVAAAILAKAGKQVHIFASHPPRSPLCQYAAQLVSTQTATSSIRMLEDPLSADSALIIDAMLGAGQSGPLRPQLLPLIQRLNRSSIPILACDVPSGSGDPAGLRCDYLLAMQCAKQQASASAAAIQIADLGIAEDCWLSVQREHLSDFPLHHSDRHKGQNGRLLVIAGGPFPGAAAFASHGALRSGCDLVYVWTAGNHHLPASIIPLVHSRTAHIQAVADDILEGTLERCSAVLIGPGIGLHPETQQAARQALTMALQRNIPCVIDADGITACTDLLRALPPKNSAAPVIITPHQQEAKRLLGEDDVSWAALHHFAHERRIILHKGRWDFISDGSQWQYHSGGNPRMSVGGSGDLLAGLCAGLMARGCRPFSAARMAVYWLCTAADTCWQSAGPCYTPEDIDQQLAPTLRQELSALNMWPPLAKES